jgi:IS30 family transposase
MSYTHITEHERYVIYHLKVFKLTNREIGRRLGRSHTTIAREVKRNGPKYRGVYWNVAAHKTAMERRHKARHTRRRSNEKLVGYVEAGLKARWSPETIVGRMHVDHPTSEKMRISAECIYAWIYRDAKSGGQLYRCLRRKRRFRRKQRRYGSGRRFIPGRIPITERPALVEKRRRFGDWEGDTVEGGKRSGFIVTHVERKSRFLVAAKLNDKRSQPLAERTVRAFSHIPAPLKKTLTFDNGSEFAAFRVIEEQAGFKVYFANPYSAWERGTNENTNGLLRDYFPKGSDFSQITDTKLDEVVARLNNRPRKCLGYRTPREVFTTALRGALAN